MTSLCRKGEGPHYARTHLRRPQRPNPAVAAAPAAARRWHPCPTTPPAAACERPGLLVVARMRAGRRAQARMLVLHPALGLPPPPSCECGVRAGQWRVAALSCARRADKGGVMRAVSLGRARGNDPHPNPRPHRSPIPEGKVCRRPRVSGWALCNPFRGAMGGAAHARTRIPRSPTHPHTHLSTPHKQHTFFGPTQALRSWTQAQGAAGRGRQAPLRA